MTMLEFIKNNYIFVKFLNSPIFCVEKFQELVQKLSSDCEDRF